MHSPAPGEAALSAAVTWSVTGRQTDRQSPTISAGQSLALLLIPSVQETELRTKPHMVNTVRQGLQGFKSY